MQKAASMMMLLLCSLFFEWEASGRAEPDVRQLERLFAGIQSSNAPTALALQIADAYLAVPGKSVPGYSFTNF